MDGLWRQCPVPLKAQSAFLSGYWVTWFCWQRSWRARILYTQRDNTPSSPHYPNKQGFSLHACAQTDQPQNNFYLPNFKTYRVQGATSRKSKTSQIAPSLDHLQLLPCSLSTLHLHALGACYLLPLSCYLASVPCIHQDHWWQNLCQIKGPHTLWSQLTLTLLITLFCLSPSTT